MRRDASGLPGWPTLVNATLGSLSRFGESVALFCLLSDSHLVGQLPEVIWGDGRDVLMLANKKDAGPVLSLHEFL